MPAYNAESFIARALASVLAQTYSRFEVLVIDDGSSDRTAHIVRSFAEQDARVRLLQQSNAGVAAARNLGIQSASGEFIAPIDSDDLWHPEAMAKIVSQFLSVGPKVGVVYAWSVDIDERDQQTGGFHAASVAGNVYKTLICHNFLGNASSTLIRKASLDHVGGYDHQLRAQNAQGCEDWDLYLRLAEHYEYSVVPEFLVSYRKVSGSLSGDFRQMARSQLRMLEAVQQKHPHLPGFLYRLSRSSFYLYLAHQCDASGHVRATLYWLRQAIKVDPITPFVRLGVHILFARSVACWLSKKGFLPKRGMAVLLPSSLTRNRPCQELASIPSEPEINRFATWLKVFVGRVLHRSLS
ncbi:MAG: glycosyltransferase family 2 protein [Cyanobacteria bacterium J06623_4]